MSHKIKNHELVEIQDKIICAANWEDIAWAFADYMPMDIFDTVVGWVDEQENLKFEDLRCLDPYDAIVDSKGWQWRRQLNGMFYSIFPYTMENPLGEALTIEKIWDRKPIKYVNP